MSESKKKSCVVAARLSLEEKAELEAKLKNTGVSISKYFRKILLDSNATFEAPKSNKDHERLLFFYNKSSNNLNQVAHRFNSAYRSSGIISESLYIKALNELIQIRELMQAGIAHAD
jgi:hypothetical protein